MKKCIVYLAVLSLLLSLCTVFASADDLPEGIQFTPGQYLGGDAEAFAPVGDVTIAWRPDISGTVNLTDGDLADWYATDLKRTNITSHNMVAWILNETTNDFKITSFAAADSDYLYLAFDIVDEDFTYGTQGGHYDGDAIQLCLDFGHKLGDVLEDDPDMISNLKNIFYSFSCEADGAPIRIMRQESDQDGWLTEANGDGVKGTARKTENGWSVEIALSWQQMYDDYVWKAWEDGPMVYVASDATLPLKMGACLYYLDRAETGKEVLWAAGTTKGLRDGNGTPAVTWMAYDNGITWKLPYQNGMSFSCNGIVILSGYETVVPETLPPETEPPYDPPVDEVTEPAIEYPETETMTAVEWEETLRDVAESMGKEDELNAVLAKYGCTAVVSMGSLTALLTVAAAAFVIRKKK